MTRYSYMMYSLSKGPSNELLFTKCAENVSYQQKNQKISSPRLIPPTPRHGKFISFNEWRDAHVDTIQDVMLVLSDTLLSLNMPLTINTTKMYEMLAARMYATSYNKDKKKLILFSGP